jgi:hypothetical protein
MPPVETSQVTLPGHEGPVPEDLPPRAPPSEETTCNPSGTALLEMCLLDLYFSQAGMAAAAPTCRGCSTHHATGTDRAAILRLLQPQSTRMSVTYSLRFVTTSLMTLRLPFTAQYARFRPVQQVMAP